MTLDEMNSALVEHGIVGRITEKELTSTGAQIKDIDYFSFQRLCEFRKLLNSPIHFIFNGITTGKHLSAGHPEGKAFDLFIPNIPPYKIICTAIDAGLKRIGVYFNGTAYSYHLENGKCALWYGEKFTANDWEYSRLVKVP